MKKILILIATYLIFAQTIFAVVIPFTTTISSNSPVMWYRAGETSGATVADSSGNNRTMTLSGGYTRNSPELLRNQTTTNKALTLSSATGSANGLTTTNAITVSFLEKFAATSGNPVIFESGTFSSSTVGYHALIYNSSNQELRWYYNKSDGTGFYNAAFFFAPELGRTYHIAVSHNYATRAIRFDIDGVIGTPIVEATSALPLTNQSVSFFSNVQGTIDELAIFNTALTPTQVQAQFAASRAADPARSMYYSSPTGSIYGRGTLLDPIELQTGMDGFFGGAGKTLLLLPGNFVGVYTMRQSGDATHRITLKPAILNTVKINGAGLHGDVLHLSGSYITVRDLEIRKTWANRTTTTVDTQNSAIIGSDGSSSVGGNGVADAGDHNEVLYCHVHNVIGDGFGSQSAATNSVYYGNLIDNNGWHAPRTLGGAMDYNGHAFYTQNTAPSVKTISHNIVFNPFGSPLKVAGSSASKIENFNLTANLYINGNFAIDIGGGDDGADNILMRSERTFRSNYSIGYNTSAGRTVDVRDGYFFGTYSPLTIQDMNSVIFTGNTVIGNNQAGESTMRITVKTAYSNSTVDNNIYYHNWDLNTSQFYSSTTGQSGAVGRSFANWKTATGWDANSTYHDGAGLRFEQPSTNKVVIEPMNDYGAGHGYIAVWNWANAATATVNLSTILTSGQKYEIHSVSNYSGGSANSNGAIYVGKYNPSSPTVTLPLKITSGLPAQCTPYGDSAIGVEPSPNFAAFVIVPQPALKINSY